MSELVPDKKVVTASYTPDQAGRQIGWVSTKTEKNVGFSNVDIVDVNIGVARVSEKGAQRGYTERTEWDGMHCVTFPDDVTGFVAASSLRLEIVRDMSVKEAVTMRPIDLAAADSDREASQMVANADGVGVMWTENPQQLLVELKKQLKDEGVEDYYGVSYYALNAAIGHAGVRSYFRNHVSTDQAPPFIGDPEMQETTFWQLANARAVAVNLGQIIDEDTHMQQELTAFSTVDADDLPAVFVGSRQIVHAAEARAIEVVQRKLIIPRYVFLPSGFRPSGRTWPYMDATIDPSDERAFGRELAALKNKKVKPAENELGKEIAETVKRLEYAQAAVRMLRGLLAAEKLAA